MIEVSLIFVLFALYAGQGTPGVNEAHYLTKTRKFWLPQWCPGDLFLESNDAHLVFVWTCGWWNLFLSLTAVAWTGRILTWALLAISFYRLMAVVVPKRWISVLAAGSWLMAMHYLHLAGEWVVGGFEAKGFAYVLVLTGLRALALGKWRTVWLWFGAAASFHVLVGGWSVVAAFFCYFTTARDDRLSVWKMLPWCVVGMLLSFPGVVPGLLLTRGVDPQLVAEAQQIYVYQRLSHHLVPHRFGFWLWIRFAALLLVWLAGLIWAYRSQSTPQRRIQRFALGALLIAGGGVLIDQLSFSRPALAANLLRFYWFRLSDAVVPLAATILLITTFLAIRARKPLAARCLNVSLILAIAVGFTVILAHRSLDTRPGADQQMLPASRGRPAVTRHIYQDWRDTCQWIADPANVPADATVLTPWHQESFKWYAGRAEVSNWKDVPQDAAALVEWWRRQLTIYPPRVHRAGLAILGQRRLLELAREFDADFIVLDKRHRGGPLGWPPQLRKVFPTTDKISFYEVYRVDQIDADEGLGDPNDRG